MHDVESAVEVIRARDATAATLAHALWHSLRMRAAHPTKVTRYDVQRTVWSSIPVVLRRPDGPQMFPDRHAVTSVLAELLDLLGYPDYAELCRAEVTRSILDAAEDVDSCDELVAAAWRESGVEPPNTPIATWLPACGPVEEALHGAAGRLLEEAIEAGEIRLGQADTEDKRIALTMRLMLSLDEETGDTWFVRLLDERLDSWILGRGSQTRREMLVRLRPEVRRTPDVSEAGLPAMQRLLEACRGEGARLTERGYLPTDVVAELVALMPTCAELDTTGRSESHWPPVGQLRELAGTLGLLKQEGRRLKLTPVGMTIADDPDSLLMRAGETVVTLENSALGFIQEIVLAALLLETQVEPDRLFDKATIALEEDDWRGEDGEAFGYRHAVAAVGWFARRLRVLDALDADWSARRVGLTEAGRSIARWALRARVLYRKESGSLWYGGFP